jgi:hypothetical protein
VERLLKNSFSFKDRPNRANYREKKPQFHQEIEVFEKVMQELGDRGHLHFVVG